MKITRRFTKAGQDVFGTVEYENRTSRISNPDGSVVFEMKDARIPKNWSQLATDIMVSKYFRKAGVPQVDTDGNPLRDEKGNVIFGPEKSASQVIHRLAGCWRFWGETHGYFDTAEDAQAFYDELAHMMLHQMCAPNSPQWFNTGLNWAYNITGPAQGHFYCDPKTGELKKSADAYSHPQPHACFIQSVSDDLVNEGGIMDLWVREARLFKYGSGTGSNFSKVRGENESLSGGGKSSGLMSFLRIGDRAAGAIKSGGTTRRAAKMCCLDLDHPDIEDFVNWKVREELKVAALVEGLKVLPKEQQDLAARLGLKLSYDFNGEAYYTVSGQNSNNSVRIPNSFFKALAEEGEWTLYNRVNGKPAEKIKASKLWEEIAYAAWRCADPGVQYDDTINQWHTCPKSGRINASNPCVTGDTRVLTPGGIWRRIDQMIHLPARLITNHEGQEIHVTEGSFPTGNKDVYELRTEGGYRLKVTADHKIWTRTRGWVEAKDLTGSDEIKLISQPTCVQEVGEPQDHRFFQLVGLYLSAASGDASAIHLNQCLDLEAIDGFAQYVSEVWGDKAYADDYPTAEEGGTITATLSQRRLISRLQAFVKVDNGERRLSDDAFTAGLAAQRHLLRALFSADAIINDETVILQSDSLSLLEDVQLILLGFGIKSAVVGSRQWAVGSEAHVLPTAHSPLPTETTHGEGGALVHGGMPDRRMTPTSSGLRSPRGDADSRRHGLRIDPGSLRFFAQYIAFLPGEKLESLATLVGSRQWAVGSEAHILSTAHCPPPTENFDRVASFNLLGNMQVFDLTEPWTSSFVANGITVHNCSEYMFLDDTACNLASLNVLTFFDSENSRFDIEAFKHATRLWTIVLEISVLMASFPSESIARLSYKFRTLGLGYANLGAMLMQAGIPYDSEKGRAICAAITAILTGESYAASAEMAKELGPFPGYFENKSDMLRVMRNHRRAAYNVRHNSNALKTLCDFESLDIVPVGIDHSQFADSEALASKQLLGAATECWDRATSLGERFGYRNAQSTVIAPTGTIGLLMDCDTTGVEPDFALVKFKKLAGGGYFKIANQSLQPALQNLGYSPEQINDILAFVMGTLSLTGVPYINYDSLVNKGFTPQELEKIEQSLPAMFELSFAFNTFSLGDDFFNRMGIPESERRDPKFNLLRKLGFTKKEIEAASEVVCGRGTVEGAPHLRKEHYAVFDCANRCGKRGERFIAVEGHIRMMAAAQPFISGAISKTINLPNEASVIDIKNSYELSWELGLKANALYRDGSKLSQPLNVKSDEEIDEEESEENVEAAREEIVGEVGKALAATVESGLSTVDNQQSTIDPNIEPVHTHIVEKIIERIVERPLRRRLPDTRHAITHKFDIGGHEGYITAGLYEDGQPGEVFITMAKEGSTIGGLMDAIATLVSVSLQYGVPVESLVRKFEHVRFEPSGMTRNPELPFAKSLVDYIFRWLAMEFVPGYRAANAPKRDAAPSPLAAEGRAEGEASDPKTGNGHGKRVEPDALPFDEVARKQSPPQSPATKSNLRLALVADPLSQQGSEMQADAPACDVCGSITVRSGTCYKCLNCGNSMGCS
jgi:ribonucleoside-diphosphate reductase alpha chain